MQQDVTGLPGYFSLTRILTALALCFSTLFSFHGYAKTSSQSYSISVVPQSQAVDIHRTWTPFLARLTILTGFRFKLKYYSDIPAFESGFKRGDTDLVFLNPYHAVMAKQSQGYIPLLRDKNLLTGILLVRVDSAIQSVKMLDGSTIAFPSPNALAASLYMRALLERAGIKFTPKYVRTHQNVYRSILVETVQAGGGIRNTLSREPDAVKSQLRILFETPPVASHTLANHPRISTPVKEQIAKAIQGMSDAKHRGDRELLMGIGLAQPVAANYADDYAPLETYQLERWIVAP